MNKKYIKWERFSNPLLSLNKNEEESGHVMVRCTPFGVEGFQFNPDFPKERVFIAHTNFDIDQDVANHIENTEGVEILEVYSPYRMKITIGKNFNAKKVRRNITNRLCKEEVYNFSNDANVAIYKETTRLNSQENPWCMFILPNGQYEVKVFDNKSEIESLLPKWELIREKIGGIILSY